MEVLHLFEKVLDDKDRRKGMTKMETSDKLREGISILFDMESNNYYMLESIRSLNRRINSLCRSKNYREPSKESGHVGITDNLEMTVLPTGVIGVVVGVIAGLVGGDTFWHKVNAVFGNAILFGIIGLIVGAVIGVALAAFEMRAEERRLEAAYQEKTAIYKKNLANDEKRMKQEGAEKAILIEQRDMLQRKLKESQGLLSHFYVTMGIDGNYRNLIPIGYMNEFIRLGIATKLEGADGLYYLVRKELRDDQFQCTLDEICGKLDRVLDNQSAIYDSLHALSVQSSQMVALAEKQAAVSARNNQMLQKAVENTRIAAYHSERTERELAFQNFMMLYR